MTQTKHHLPTVNILRCGACKHWEAQPTNEPVGWCRRIANDWAADDDFAIVASPGLPIGKGETLQTLPTFGCVLWEARG